MTRIAKIRHPLPDDPADRSHMISLAQSAAAAGHILEATVQMKSQNIVLVLNPDSATSIKHAMAVLNEPVYRSLNDYAIEHGGDTVLFMNRDWKANF